MDDMSGGLGFIRSRRLTQTLALAAAYFLAARVGETTASPPGFAAPIALPAGIALSALILFSDELWPGILLSAFAVHTGFGAAVLPLEARSLPVTVAAAIAIGSTLQALAGVRIIRRVLGLPSPLDNVRDVTTFLLLAGPASCLIGATVAQGALWAAGLLPISALPRGWWTLWFGDTTGVLAVAPMAVLLASRAQARPGVRAWAVAIPLAATYMVGALVVAYSNARDDEVVRDEFERRTARAALALRSGLAADMDVLEAIASFYDCSPSVSRRDFHVFVQHFLARHPGIQALEWIPRVTGDRRDAMESAARADGLAGFEFTQRQSQGRMVRRAPAQEYFPVYYLEPLATNEIAAGFDLASDPDRLAALGRARDTAQPTATARITLVQEKGSQFGVLIFVPVYERDRPHETVRSRRETLRGYALGVFRIADMVEAALRPLGHWGIAVQITDLGVTDGGRVLHDSSASAAWGVADPSDAMARGTREGLQWRTVRDMGGRPWEIRFSTRADDLAAHLSWNSWFAPASALLLCGLMAGFLLVLTGRTARVEDLVQERTAALDAAREALRSATNAEMRLEIQYEVVRVLAEAHSLDEAGPRLAWAIAQAIDWDTVTLWLAGPVDGTVRCVGTWGRPQAGFEAFLALTHATTFQRGQGIPGRTIAQALPIWVDDLVADPRVRRVADAGAVGLSTMAVCPIGKDQEVVGAIEICARAQVPRDRSLEDMLTSVGAQVAQFIQRRSLEQQLNQSQKMEAIGRLAGGVAHDFNNLLMVILGYAAELSDAPDLAAPERDGIWEIRRAAERATQLVRQLLAFSHRQVFQPRRIDLSDVVAGAERMLRRVIGEDIELAVSLSARALPVMADPGQIEQVLMNLAVNARDAMPDGGRLVLRTDLFEPADAHGQAPDAGSPVRQAMLVVTDTGSGMDSSTLAHIFEPFFTTKGVGKGTGLGLSTVYGIVKQSGGRIEVTSAPGQGTTFQVIMPIAREDAGATAVPVTSAPPARGKETILLVEDQPDVLLLTRRTLERLGYAVLEARGGEAALRASASFQGPIHLLLTDVIMPGMSGRETAIRLVEARPELKVLYMSGYADSVISQSDMLGPGIAFIEKPFSRDALAGKVRMVLDAARPPPPASGLPA